MQIIVFLAFTALVAVISYLKSATDKTKISDGYFLGGRSLTGVVIAGSLLLTNLSTEQIVGLNGAAFREGILVMAWETLAAIAMVVTAVFLLPRYLKGGITTVPQFLESRYDHSTKTITSILFLSGYVVVLLPIVLYSGALAISSLFEVPELLGVSDAAALWICVWGIGLVGSVYAIFGGLKAVAISDTVNAIGLLIGGLLIPVFGLLAVGDGNVLTGFSTIMEAHPDKFQSMGGPKASVPFATIFTGMMLVQLFYWGYQSGYYPTRIGCEKFKGRSEGIAIGIFYQNIGAFYCSTPWYNCISHVWQHTLKS